MDSDNGTSGKQKILRPSGFIQSVDRAISIMELFTIQKPEAGVTEISRALGLNKSTAFGLLCTLERRGYIEQDPASGKYRLGLKTLELASVKLAGFDVVRIAHPLLESLVSRLGETVHLAIYDKGEVIYIDKVESENTLRIASFVGKRNPAYCTGVGKCLLAFQPKEEVERVAGRGFPARTPKTIVDRKTFLERLEEVKSRDMAYDDEEFVLGLACVAAPVRNSAGEVIAAVSVSAPTIRSSAERFAMFEEEVRSTALTISETLGYRPTNFQ